MNPPENEEGLTPDQNVSPDTTENNDNNIIDLNGSRGNNNAHVEVHPFGIDPLAVSRAFMLADLAKSGLVPSDFPHGVEPIMAWSGQGAYKLFTTPTYYITKLDRDKDKYVGLKGVTPPITCFGEFHGAPLVATVEGYKKALLFHKTTGIPTICIPGCWMFGETVDMDAEMPVKTLHSDILKRLAPNQNHLTFIDGDWATNEQVRNAQATYRLLQEEQGVKFMFKNLGAIGGYDDWFVDTYGIDRSTWPAPASLLQDILKNIPNVPTEALIGGALSFMVGTLDRLSNEYLDLNDRGAGTLLVKLIGADRLKLCTDTGRWVQWNGRKWDLLPNPPLRLVNVAAQYYFQRADILIVQAKKQSLAGNSEQAAKLNESAKLYKNFANKNCSSTSGRNSVIKDLESRSELHVLSSFFDSKPNLLGVANGVVDLDTGVLRPEVPEDYLLAHAPIPYRNTPGVVTTDVVTRSLNTFLMEVTGIERNPDQSIKPEPQMLDYLQRRLGLMLRGENAEQTFDIWQGGGANGKSVLQNLIHAALGATREGGYATTLKANVILNTNEQSSEGASPFLMLAKGARIVFLAETKDTAVLNDALIKQATGEAWLSARGNYQDGGHIRVAFNLVLLTNPLPNCTHVDAALLDRLTIIPFSIRWQRRQDLVPNPEEINLPLADRWWAMEGHKEQALLEALLYWMVEGAVKWKAEGLPTAPDRVIATVQHYKEDNDRLGDWFRGSHFTWSPSGEVLIGELASSFHTYLIENGLRSISPATFSRRFREQFKSKVERLERGGKNYIKGVRLKTEKELAAEIKTVREAAAAEAASKSGDME